MEPAVDRLKVDISKPRYDQSTYSGRAKHFFIVTNPFNILASSTELEQAKLLVTEYRNKAVLPGLTADQLWRAKQLYDSTYHPDTGEKMFVLGRMSAQVPCNMLVTGCMLTFYKTTPAVIFWQWINQSFNAVVNYTNRSGANPISEKQLGLSYLGATTGAIVTALSLNRLAPRFPPIIGRFVPFAAVAAANSINLPMMRSNELVNGIPVLTADGEALGESRKAAQSAITQVVVSRILMAVPGMFIPPILMAKLEKRSFLRRYPMMSAPLQVLMVGASLVLATPLCCALFPQMSSMKTSRLESELKAKVLAHPSSPDKVYFNKGL
ncbi:sideroflexin-1-like isoform X1 [Watersipora subatra]|uniref:sideroflexin-1-like isoform X1 n=1 Tax=Watersipora subatra TaxID=2589382 RepID=UPI00355AFFBE